MMELALIAYALGALADVWTTNRVLSQGGRELNPVMAKLIEKLGKAWPLGKLALNAFAGWICWSQGLVVLCWAFAAFNWLLAAQNYRHIR